MVLDVHAHAVYPLGLGLLDGDVLLLTDGLEELIHIAGEFPQSLSLGDPRRGVQGVVEFVPQGVLEFLQGVENFAANAAQTNAQDLYGGHRLDKFPVDHLMEYVFDPCGVSQLELADQLLIQGRKVRADHGQMLVTETLIEENLLVLLQKIVVPEHVLGLLVCLGQGREPQGLLAHSDGDADVELRLQDLHHLLQFRSDGFAEPLPGLLEIHQGHQLIVPLGDHRQVPAAEDLLQHIGQEKEVMPGGFQPLRLGGKYVAPALDAHSQDAKMRSLWIKTGAGAKV